MTTLHANPSALSPVLFLSLLCFSLTTWITVHIHRHWDVETETRMFYELPLPLNNNTLHATFVIKMWSFEGLTFFFLLRCQNFTPPHCQISSNARSIWSGTQGSLRNALFSASGLSCGSFLHRLKAGDPPRTSRLVANHKPLWRCNCFAMAGAKSYKLELKTMLIEECESTVVFLNVPIRGLIN